MPNGRCAAQARHACDTLSCTATDLPATFRPQSQIGVLYWKSLLDQTLSVLQFYRSIMLFDMSLSILVKIVTTLVFQANGEAGDTERRRRLA